MLEMRPMRAKRQKHVRIIFEEDRRRPSLRRYMAEHGKRGAEAVILAAVCAFTTIAAALTPAQRAEARTSLPHIEEIKSSLNSASEGESALKILEIVPETDDIKDTSKEINYTGEFGFLVEGQEPADFAAELASIQGKAAREAFADRYLGSLQALGLLGYKTDSDGTDYPLTPVYSADGKLYRELYPWEIPAGEDSSSYSKLAFAPSESVYAAVSCEQADEADADFSAEAEAYIVKQGGDYAQKITSMIAASSLPAGADISSYVFWRATLSPVDTSTDPDPNNYLQDYVVRRKLLPDGTSDEDAEWETADISMGWQNGYEYMATDKLAGSASDVRLGGKVTDAELSAMKAENRGWYAASGPIVRTGNGTSRTSWFAIDPSYVPEELVYVGRGNGGSYRLKTKPADYYTEPGEGRIKLTTDHTLYKGGYKNNNWLLRYVLNYEEADFGSETAFETALSKAASAVTIDAAAAPAVRVTATDQAKAAGQSADLKDYDLIILSAGIGLAGSGDKTSYGNAAAYASADLFSTDETGVTAGTDGTVTYSDESVYEYLRDVYASSLTGVEGKGDGLKLPILYDLSVLYDANSSKAAYLIGSLISRSYYTGEETEDLIDPVNALNSRKVAGYQNGYAYENTAALYSADVSALVGAGFPKSYEKDCYSGTDSAFYPVYKEIAHENALRTREGATGNALLRDAVGEAEVIRYLLNYKGQRPANTKEEIRILDIEPDNHSEITKDGTPSTQTNRQDPKDEVKAWFGGMYDEKAIQITTMSTAEFVTKIEDITENYDAIYIGSDTTDYNKDDSGVPIYNDTSMNGLIYYNVGDISLLQRRQDSNVNDGSGTGKGADNAAGLMVSNYDVNGNLKNSNDQFTYYRYSGNDLTEKRAKAVKEFAEMGYPVILSDMLTNYAALPQTKTSYKTVWLKLDRSKSQWDGDYNSWQGRPYVYFYDSYTPWPGKPMNYYQTEGQYEYWYYRYDASKNPSTCIFNNNSRTGSGQTLDGNASLRAGNCFSLNWKDWRSGKWTVNAEWFDDGVLFDVNPVRIQEAAPAEDISINQTTVDNTSRLYSLLTEIKDRDNVFAAGKAAENAQKVFEYVNLAQPTIVFPKDENQNETGKPVAYTEDKTKRKSLDALDAEGNVILASDKETEIAGYRIQYSFRIVNATDSSPDTSTYSVHLYIDQNSDGLYTESGDDSEEIDDLIVTDTQGQQVDFAALRGGLTEDSAPLYTVTRILPSTFQGIMPWKLMVVQNSHADVAALSGHDSETGQTYIKGRNPIPLKVLQINSDAYGNNRTIYNLEWEQQKTNGQYNGTYGSLLAAVDDFDITIDTVYASVWATNWSGNGHKTEPFNEWGGTSGSVQERAEKYRDFLADYDMILIGFSDSFRTLNTPTALAVQAFAKSGRSVVFSHDTCGNNNAVDVIKPLNTIFGSTNGRFAFDQLLRSTLYLDQYGIADRTLHTRASDGSTFCFGGLRLQGLDYDKEINQPDGILGHQIVLHEDNQKDDEILQALDDARYSIAWIPGSGTSGSRVMDTTTQGLTDFNIRRDRKVGTELDKLKNDKVALGENSETNSVSQVNKGQITSYPYDVNTIDFGGTIKNRATNKMDVSATHLQWNQINLNSDNIVVWYCLADTYDNPYSPSAQGYGILPNDGVNEYYIFSAGNVTYTGAGHAGNHTNPYYTENEAKLFVNTMVASYRARKTAPEGGFYSSADGDKPITNLVLSNTDSATDYTPANTEKPTHDTEYASNDSMMSTLDSDGVKVYFRVNDTNVVAGRKLGVYLTVPTEADSNAWNNTQQQSMGSEKRLYYSSVDPNAQPDDESMRGKGGSTTLQIFKASDNTELQQGESLESGVMYYCVLPASVQTYISHYSTLLEKGITPFVPQPKITLLPYSTYSENGQTKYAWGTTPYTLTIQTAGLMPIG